jgi:hypothetical protein
MRYYGGSSKALYELPRPGSSGPASNGMQRTALAPLLIGKAFAASTGGRR